MHLALLQSLTLLLDDFITFLARSSLPFKVILDGNLLPSALSTFQTRSIRISRTMLRLTHLGRSMHPDLVSASKSPALNPTKNFWNMIKRTVTNCHCNYSA